MKTNGTETENVGPFVWLMTNGKFVHPLCREWYSKKHEKPIRPGILSAVYEGYPMSRFTLCAHCEVPIWNQSKNA